MVPVLRVEEQSDSMSDGGLEDYELLEGPQIIEDAVPVSRSLEQTQNQMRIIAAGPLHRESLMKDRLP